MSEAISEERIGRSVPLGAGERVVQRTVPTRLEEVVTLRRAPHPSISLHWIGDFTDGRKVGFDGYGKSLMGSGKIVRRADEAPPVESEASQLRETLSQRDARIAELEAECARLRGTSDARNGNAAVIVAPGRYPTRDRSVAVITRLDVCEEDGTPCWRGYLEELGPCDPEEECYWTIDGRFWFDGPEADEDIIGPRIEEPVLQSRPEGAGG